MNNFTNRASLVAAYLTAGQTVTIQGDATPGDGIVNTYLIQTPAEFGGTPDELSNLTIANGNVAALQSIGAVTPERILPDGVVTPSVLGGEQFITANTTATTITNFTDVSGGQSIRILFNDANTTVESNTDIKLTDAVNFVGAVGDVLTLMYSPTTTAWHEQARSLA